MVPSTNAELTLTIVLITLSVALLAWIIGTTSLVVVRADEQAGQYRRRLGDTLAYARARELPYGLEAPLLEGLRIDFTTAARLDDAVLGRQPRGMRRQVLLQRYKAALTHDHAALKGCSGRFVAALLEVAAEHVHAPQVRLCWGGVRVCVCVCVRVHMCVCVVFAVMAAASRRRNQATKNTPP